MTKRTREKKERARKLRASGQQQQGVSPAHRFATHNKRRPHHAEGVPRSRAKANRRPNPGREQLACRRIDRVAASGRPNHTHADTLLLYDRYPPVCTTCAKRLWNRVRTRAIFLLATLSNSRKTKSYEHTRYTTNGIARANYFDSFFA